MSSDQVSKELGQKMLAGWKMLADHCPICYTPLLLEKGDHKRFCCSCKAYLVTEEEAKEHKLTITDSVEDFQAKQQALTTKQQDTTNTTNNDTTTPQTNNKSTLSPTPSTSQQPPSLPTTKKPSLTQSTPVQQQQQQPQSTTKALIDTSFEDEINENEMQTQHIEAKQAYNDLKSLYSKLMNGSGSFLGMGVFDADNDENNNQDDDENIPSDDEHEAHTDIDYGPTKQHFREQLLKGSNLLQSLQHELNQDTSHMVAKHHSIMEMARSMMFDTIDINENNNKNGEKNNSKQSSTTTPPDPDDDWEYYNSHDTDITTHIDHLDTKMLQKAQKQFTQLTLSGWIFSSHICDNCSQILLFPPSAITPDEISDDIIKYYNQTLQYHHDIPTNNSTTSKNTQLQRQGGTIAYGDVEFDSCEYIRALCTYCGWFCLTDDGYIESIQHECCDSTQVTIYPLPNGMNCNQNNTNNINTTNSSKTSPTTTTQTSSTTSNQTDEWSKRIAAAINASISNNTTPSKISSTHNIDDIDETTYDYHNLNGLDETRALLASDELKLMHQRLNEKSTLLSQALGQGKLLLDEYCPDCSVPLVGLITENEYDTIVTNNGHSHGKSGMKLHINQYKTMPKECVVCQQQWNMDKKDDGLKTIPITNNNIVQQPTPSPQSSIPMNQQSIRSPTIPTRPIVTQSPQIPPPQQQTQQQIPQSQQQEQQQQQQQQIPQSQQPSQSQPQFDFQQQQSFEVHLKDQYFFAQVQLSSHLASLQNSLSLVTDQIERARQAISRGESTQYSFDSLFVTSTAITNAITACKAAMK